MAADVRSETHAALVCQEKTKNRRLALDFGSFCSDAKVDPRLS